MMNIIQTCKKNVTKNKNKIYQVPMQWFMCHIVCSSMYKVHFNNHMKTIKFMSFLCNEYSSNTCKKLFFKKLNIFPIDVCFWPIGHI